MGAEPWAHSGGLAHDPDQGGRRDEKGNFCLIVRTTVWLAGVEVVEEGCLENEGNELIHLCLVCRGDYATFHFLPT